MKKGFIVFAVILFFAATVFAQGPVIPKKMDKCPVCGMMVSKYPKWVAEVIFKDGSYFAFDGPKDMFKFLFNMSKYTKKNKDDIAAIYVTDYYTGKFVNAKDEDVYFVLGSNVYGPMGVELVPIKGKKEAEIFMKDHNGKRMLRFSEVTMKDIPMMKMKMKMHMH